MKSLKRLWFDWTCKGILDTERIIPNTPDICIVTMLGHNELFMYLVAIKSFVHYLDFVPQIYVLSDGSLTVLDRMLLHEHIDNLNVCFISNIEQHPDVPIGGTWERLLLITELVKDYYVIQLDSDTVTLSKPYAVLKAIKDKSNFTLTDSRRLTDVISMRNAAGLPWRGESNLVQDIFEKNLSKDVSVTDETYVCGNSGFVGYAEESFDKDSVVGAAKLIQRSCGDKIHEWGSEQLASNIIVANSLRSEVVVLGKEYGSYLGHPLDNPVLIHFIGRHRFDKQAYIRAVRDTIKEIKLDANYKKGVSLQVTASRLRGEGSRIMAEAARLSESGIPELEKLGSTFSKIGKATAIYADEMFAEGTALITKDD